MVHTKIICTIGVKTSDEQTLERLVDAGMNVARLNFSHGTHEFHAQVIRNIQAVRERKQIPLAILLDTKGPEIRVGSIRHGSMSVHAGMKLRLMSQVVEGSEQGVTLSPAQVLPYIKLGSDVLIDDGYLQAVVSREGEDEIEIEFINSGELKTNKSVSIRNIELALPFMTEKDVADLEFGAQHGIDFIAASFVRQAEDIKEIQSCLQRVGREDIPIIAKIENALGVENFNSIAQVADGIMIARGDLGIELPVVQVPILQKKMAYESRAKGRLCITATQMLESMIWNSRPTRAEVSDIANAILDGTSAVMLSGETASGQYPVHAVSMMRSVIQETEKNISYHHFIPVDDQDMAIHVSDRLGSLSAATIDIAERSAAKAIIVYTETGGSPRILSKYRSEFPIIAVTPNTRLYYHLALEWGVFPMITDSLDRAVWRAQACQFGIQQGLLSQGDRVIVLGRVSGTDETNSLTIATVQEILKTE